MIKDETLELLKAAIKEYDKLVGKDYLIACTINKRYPLEFCVFRIKKENFLHLLGCKCIIDESHNMNCEVLYDKLLGGENISESLSYTSNKHGSKDKYIVFMRLFDFVSHAKEIQITKTDNSPEQYMFKISAGNYYGIIGYDSRNESILFPKTVQHKTSSSINQQCMRISFILSKDISSDSFDSLEYCVSKKHFTELIKQLPDNYLSSFRDNS